MEGYQQKWQEERPLKIFTSLRAMKGVPTVAQRVINLTSTHEDADPIPGLAQWVGDLVLLWCSCRCALDPTLLWLCCVPAATALIPPLAWEFPYATGAVLKSPPPPQKKAKTGKKKSNHKMC